MQLTGCSCIKGREHFPHWYDFFIAVSVEEWNTNSSRPRHCDTDTQVLHTFTLVELVFKNFEELTEGFPSQARNSLNRQKSWRRISWGPRKVCETVTHTPAECRTQSEFSPSDWQLTNKNCRAKVAVVCSFRASLSLKLRWWQIWTLIGLAGNMTEWQHLCLAQHNLLVSGRCLFPTKQSGVSLLVTVLVHVRA